jgi:hypothetical protein
MKKGFFIVIVIALISLIFVNSCKDDIILEPLPTLEGTYAGEFRVITGYQTPSADTSSSTIEMQFSDESYFFDSDNTPDAFCNPRGTYTLAANNIELTETDKNCSSVIAKERDNPRGQFSIRRPADSVIMLQQASDTLKQILLKKQ